MHFSLVLVGAHDGSGTQDLVRQATAEGRVLLVEPVPFLFRRLEARYAHSLNIVLRNMAVGLEDGEAAFTAPKESANFIAHFADQLGSMAAGHAAAHDPRLSPHFETIRTRVSRFETLIEAEGISSIDTLLTDTEGADTDLLPTFPFFKIVPKRIIFEFKHADGPFRVGRKLAHLLVFLEDNGYRIHALDKENMIATHLG